MAEMRAHAEEVFEAADLELSTEEKELIRASTEAPEAAVRAVSSLYAARISERALSEHASALREAARAAAEHSKGLKRATWCLVAATVVLAVAAVTQALVHLTL